MHGKLRALLTAILLAAISFTTLSTAALAHGESAQEPYLRTRTAIFYDIVFDKTKVDVGEDFTVRGKFRLMEDWPDAVELPKTVYVSMVSPGPVVTRVNSWVNGEPARQSFADFKLGGEYEFEITMEGRVPGRHHIHPSLSVKGAGALVGPGMWIEVVDTGAPQKVALATITGVQIPDLANWGMRHVLVIQGVWLALGVVWLLWWVRRPLLLPRWAALKKDREDVLYSGRDVLFAFVLGLVCVGFSIATYAYSSRQFPYIVPLQAGTLKTDPLPQALTGMKATVLHATYDVPGRSMKLKVELTNNESVPMTIGELTTANVRFLNQALPEAAAGIPANYPQDLIAPSGLDVSDPSPLQPGETRVVDISASDAVWENERLVSFLTDVDSKFGALLFFYTPDGQREIVEVDGPIIPVFTEL